MISIEKTCASCGRKFIIREAETDKWKKIRYCVLCNRNYRHKKQLEEKRIEDEKWKETKAREQQEFEKLIAERHNVINLSNIHFDDDNVLYIIGNGFDLMHGVKSSYYSFRDSLDNSFIWGLEAFWTPDDLWSDFENNLAYFNAEMMVSRFMIDDWLDNTGFFQEEESAANFYMAVEFAVEPIARVSRELPKKLRTWVERLEVRTDDRPLASLIRNGKVLNFNYTEFIESLYGVSVENVCYIHGCRRKIKYHPKEELIMGHKQGASDESYEFDEKEPRRKTYHSVAVELAQERAMELLAAYDEDLTKKTEEIIKGHQNFFDSLSAVENVVIIGHSLSEVDWDYFQKVQESIENPDKVLWYIGCHGLGDLKNLDKLVSWLGIKNVRIFRTDLTRVNRYPEPVIQKREEPIKSILKKDELEIKTGKNILQIIDSDVVNYEAVIGTPINRAVLTSDRKGILMISYAYPCGIQLMHREDGIWKYIAELKAVQNQAIINRRLRKVLMTDEVITFVYNSRVRKYSLIDGAVVLNQAIRQAPERDYSSDGIDVTDKFVRTTHTI